MEHILLKVYLNDNLGDDLFIQILSNRYQNKQFYIISYKKTKAKFNKNIHIYNSKYNKLLNRTIKLLSFSKTNLEKIVLRKCKVSLMLGGSMFIEGSHKKIKNNKKILNNLYILGTNFGPYTSNNFKKYYESVFSKAKDVCFREKYSYDLFKNLKNVRYTSDIVFGLDTNSIKITNNKKVIISVIDCEKKQNNDHTKKYESLIVDIINKFDELGYDITLMSFCKNEGDEEAIKRILNKINNQELKNKINQYNYGGNLEEALNVLGDSQIIVGSRFHANILGLVMNKTIIPIAYSDKTINTLKDINYKGKIIDIRKLEDFNVDDITEKDLNYKINIDKYRKEAEKHFEKLDKVLK